MGKSIPFRIPKELRGPIPPPVSLVGRWYAENHWAAKKILKAIRKINKKARRRKGDG